MPQRRIHSFLVMATWKIKSYEYPGKMLPEGGVTRGCHRCGVVAEATQPETLGNSVEGFLYYCIRLLFFFCLFLLFFFGAFHQNWFSFSFFRSRMSLSFGCAWLSLSLWLAHDLLTDCRLPRPPHLKPVCLACYLSALLIRSVKRTKKTNTSAFLSVLHVIAASFVCLRPLLLATQKAWHSSSSHLLANNAGQVLRSVIEWML